MADFSAAPSSAASGSAGSGDSNNWRVKLKKAVTRCKAWYQVQTQAVQTLVLAAILLAPVGAGYGAYLLHKRAQIDQEVAALRKTEKRYSIDSEMPVVLGSGSMLGFLDGHKIDRVTVIYSDSDRIMLVESEAKQYTFYPRDALELSLFQDRAAQQPWGSTLAFVPRADLDPASLTVLERLDRRFSGTREQADTEPSYLLRLIPTLLLTLLLLVPILKSQFKSLKFLDPAKIQGSLDDLVGMDDIKAEIAQIKDQYLRRTEYAAYGVRKPFNVMFSGPAGTGKTKLASCLAKELNLPILFHSAANLETGFVAGGASTLTRIVNLAKRRKRCIVFLDEAQDLFMKRGGRRKFDDDTQNTLLAILNGVQTKDDAEIIWIVASNFNSEQMQMDEAMLRRFQMKVDFRLPNKDERRAILAHYLKQRAEKVAAGTELTQLVEVTEGRSPADLETIVDQAGIAAVRAGALIDDETLMRAAERVMLGNVNANTTKDRERDRRIIAIHEWGHFLVDFAMERQAAGGDWDKLHAALKTVKISLKANPRNNALGFVLHKQGPNLLKTKADIEHDVRVLLGGMANEELFFGEDGTTTGAHSDITQVTRLLHQAVAEMGMYRKTRLNFSALTSEPGRVVDDETRAIMEAQSERLYGETKSVLEQLKPVTAHLTDELLAKGEMSVGEALFEIRRLEANGVRPVCATAD